MGQNSKGEQQVDDVIEAAGGLEKWVDTVVKGQWVGTTLVILGVAVDVAAAVKHWFTIRRLQRGQPLEFRRWSLGMVVAFLLRPLALLTATYLLAGLVH